jgi:hypothetical protein
MLNDQLCQRSRAPGSAALRSFFKFASLRGRRLRRTGPAKDRSRHAALVVGTAPTANASLEFQRSVPALRGGNRK